MGALTKVTRAISGLSNGTGITNEYQYTHDRLTSITHNGFTYTFEYDIWGNQTKVKAGSQTLANDEHAGNEVHVFYERQAVEFFAGC